MKLEIVKVTGDGEHYRILKKKWYGNRWYREWVDIDHRDVVEFSTFEDALVCARGIAQRATKPVYITVCVIDDKGNEDYEDYEDYVQK